MSGVLHFGARILVPSFSLWQNSSSMWIPGYGEAPVGARKDPHWLQEPFHGFDFSIFGDFLFELQENVTVFLSPREKISHSRMP